MPRRKKGSPVPENSLDLDIDVPDVTGDVFKGAPKAEDGSVAAEATVPIEEAREMPGLDPETTQESRNRAQVVDAKRKGKAGVGWGTTDALEMFVRVRMVHGPNGITIRIIRQTPTEITYPPLKMSQFNTPEELYRYIYSTHHKQSVEATYKVQYILGNSNSIRGVGSITMPDTLGKQEGSDMSNQQPPPWWNQQPPPWWQQQAYGAQPGYPQQHGYPPGYPMQAPGGYPPPTPGYPPNGYPPPAPQGTPPSGPPQGAPPTQYNQTPFQPPPAPEAAQQQQTMPDPRQPPPPWWNQPPPEWWQRQMAAAQMPAPPPQRDPSADVNAQLLMMMIQTLKESLRDKDEQLRGILNGFQQPREVPAPIPPPPPPPAPNPPSSWQNPPQGFSGAPAGWPQAPMPQGYGAPSPPPAPAAAAQQQPINSFAAIEAAAQQIVQMKKTFRTLESVFAPPNEGADAAPPLVPTPPPAVAEPIRMMPMGTGEGALTLGFKPDGSIHMPSTAFANIAKIPTWIKGGIEMAITAQRELDAAVAARNAAAGANGYHPPDPNVIDAPRNGAGGAASFLPAPSTFRQN